MEKSSERLEVLERIKQAESNAEFDKDVENDPPELELFPSFYLWNNHPQ